MISWLIFGSILVIILIALLSKLKIHLEFAKDSEPVLNVTFLGMNLYRFTDEKKTEDEERVIKGKQQKVNKLSLKKHIKTYDDVIELLHTIKNILIKFKKLIKNALSIIHLSWFSQPSFLLLYFLAALHYSILKKPPVGS